MVRPSKARKMDRLPAPVIYIPAGWTKGSSPVVEVAIEDFEIMRLVDGRGYHLQEAAEKIGVSRSTAGRMLERVRREIALGIEKQVPFSIDAGQDLLLEPYLKPKGAGGFPLAEKKGHCLAVACQNVHPDSPVERIFGRSPAFVLIQGDGTDPVQLDNPGFGVKRNAAGFAVEFLKQHGVNRVVAGRFGPEALELLAKSKIQVLISGGLSLGQTLAYIKESQE